MATTLNFSDVDSWYAGEDKVITFNVVQPTQIGIPPVIQDITGWTIKMSLSASVGGPNVGGFPITAVLTTPTQGLCTVTVPAAYTAALTQVQYYWTLWRTDAGFKTELAGGTVTVNTPQTVAP